MFAVAALGGVGYYALNGQNSQGESNKAADVNKVVEKAARARGLLASVVQALAFRFELKTRNKSCPTENAFQDESSSPFIRVVLSNET